MTRQTTTPLEHIILNPSFRPAREISRLVESGDLLLSPPYQRGLVWEYSQKVDLVESWLRGIPTGNVILSDRATGAWAKNNGDVYKTGEAIWACVDGQQRITTARQWFADEFAAPASWFGDEYVETTEETDDGLYVRYGGLTLVGQRRMTMRAQLQVAEFRTAATVEDEARVYLLVNGGGTPQTSEDMANAARIAKGSVVPAPATEQVHPMELEPGDYVSHPTMGEVEVLDYPVKHQRGDGTAYATTEVHQRGTSLRGNAVWPLPTETPEENHAS